MSAEGVLIVVAGLERRYAQRFGHVPMQQRRALHFGVPPPTSAIRDVPPQEQAGKHALHAVHSRWPIKMWIDRQRWLFQAPEFGMGNQFPVRAKPPIDRPSDFRRPRQLPRRIAPADVLDGRHVSSTNPAACQRITISKPVEQGFHATVDAY